MHIVEATLGQTWQRLFPAPEITRFWWTFSGRRCCCSCPDLLDASAYLGKPASPNDNAARPEDEPGGAGQPGHRGNAAAGQARLPVGLPVRRRGDLVDRQVGAAVELLLQVGCHQVFSGATYDGAATSAYVYQVPMS